MGQDATAVVAIKIDKTVIIVSAVVGSLGLLSAILGFAAESNKLTSCLYSSTNSSALGLGVCAAIFLLMAQVTVTAVGGCCGCCKSRAIPSETKRIVAIVCAVLSWKATLIAFVMFLDAGVVASQCFIVRDGFFAGAGVLALIATALGITSFILLLGQPDDGAAARRGEPTPVGIPMGAVPGYPPRPPHPAAAAQGSGGQPAP
ncbi:uncharacterized protein LOC102703782 [Oryza brachyantha]|uniref:Uncharacterized protein n=1 Tax=Oryza brachyantha TaxID=4533 RepID=J3M7I0_ORYBR|nr:uncharacterized protein LOC102703782 [Oryza brachyantha]